MIDEAIKKITDEMMKLDTPFARAIEEYLTRICTSEAVAEKILEEGKSLQGALDAIKEAARENQQGGVGVVSDEEGYRIVREYFGITDAGTVNVLDLL